jgi:hypothetical protein
MGNSARVEGEVKKQNVLIVGIRHLQNFFAGVHIPARDRQCIRSSEVRNAPLNTKPRLGEAKEIVHRDEIYKCIPNIAP